VFVIIGHRTDVAAIAKQEMLSTLEHFSHIRTSCLDTRDASPGVAVGSVGGRPVGDVGQHTGGQVMMSAAQDSLAPIPVSNVCPSVHTYVHAYVRPSTKSSFDFNEIWHVGRGR